MLITVHTWGSAGRVHWHNGRIGYAQHMGPPGIIVGATYRSDMVPDAHQTRRVTGIHGDRVYFIDRHGNVRQTSIERFIHWAGL